MRSRDSKLHSKLVGQQEPQPRLKVSDARVGLEIPDVPLPIFQLVARIPSRPPAQALQGSAKTSAGSEVSGL